MTLDALKEKLNELRTEMVKFNTRNGQTSSPQQWEAELDNFIDKLQHYLSKKGVENPAIEE
jgi:hypothetical protein